jgi:hydrogen cyanide synthase HcnB
MSQSRVVIIGAGPAGTRAAQCLVAHGLQPIVITEAADNGGQIYRRQPPGFMRAAKKLYGAEAHKANALHAAFDELRSRIVFRPNTTVWNIVERTLFLDSPEGIEELVFDALIIATGAMDRIIPLPGWTLPGVFTLGGAQIALKFQACAIGERVAFVGTGPLLYLVAYQYAKAGARVAGVFDTSSSSNKLGALPGMLFNSPRTTLLGLYYLGWLRAHGVRVVQGAHPLEVLGEGRASALRYADASGQHTLECDAVGLGYGLKPESQLAELAGCQFHFDQAQRLWAVTHDGAGRVRPGIYVAGDCTSIGGADVAELQGELAALSLLSDLSIVVPPERSRVLAAKLQRLGRFRAALERAFPFPQHVIRDIPKQTILCRCETITAQEVDEVTQQLHPDDINRVKAFSRTGMGRCQGRVCGPAIAEYMAARDGVAVSAVGRLRSQAPVKPLAYAKAAQRAQEGHALRRPACEPTKIPTP